MSDKEMWEWVMEKMKVYKIADLATRDQMLAARRDFKPVLPIMDLDDGVQPF